MGERPIGSTTRRNQVIIAAVALFLVLCCGGMVAAAFVTSGNPSCPAGAVWDGEECEGGERDWDDD